MARRLLLICAVVVLAGCGGGGGSSSSRVEQFGYIRSVSTAGPTATLAFDEAEWLEGKAAQRAAEEDGAVPPGEPVPNDYYIRNTDKTTRTLPIDADAEITAHRCMLCRDGKPGELAGFLAAFGKKGQTYADPYRGSESLYWLTIEDGRVVAIDEQYVP